MIDHERQQRRDKSLCYRCKKPFAFGHRCKPTHSIMEYGDNNDNLPLEIVEETKSYGQEDTVVEINHYETSRKGEESIDFYLFSMSGLGIKWLATLNTIIVDWKEMFLIFTIDGKKHKLQGLKPNLKLSMLHTLQSIDMSHHPIPPLSTITTTIPPPPGIISIGGVTCSGHGALVEPMEICKNIGFVNFRCFDLRTTRVFGEGAMIGTYMQGSRPSQIK
ncbi:hypothetical protein LIER_03610 [Lithospermum erythrorhizon]|uniref:Uncharacterized protein n=1 Tax=Lithospermum erythrorhizon TaxID=34254 RepID=A0AAV3NYE9_LITER